ncbi:hypothetical protein EVAR_80435_1 [Eumeta japonica]|uniref:Uncharacterized protein n=1 Tax=Eumeta variegata TaxID=151549 RepID=A0A4C1VHT3_EUMVA|nr:hypothetical protein EVAR_80435_1 [Eumeta japonica]
MNSSTVSGDRRRYVDHDPDCGPALVSRLSQRIKMEHLRRALPAPNIFTASTLGQPTGPRPEALNTKLKKNVKGYGSPVKFQNDIIV